MEEEKLIQFFDGLQKAFLDGRFEDVERHFVVPLVVYSVAGVTLVRDSGEFAVLLRDFWNALTGLNVSSSKFELSQYDQPKNGRMRVTVTFSDFDADGTQVTGSEVRYFLLESDDGLKVEMIEYLREPFSPSVVENIVH